MVIAVLLVLVGVLLIASSPILGLIPGILLIVVGAVVAVLSLLGRGVGAFLRVGYTKSCPECRATMPATAEACPRCGHRFE